jgi:hypothetical protein
MLDHGVNQIQPQYESWVSLFTTCETITVNSKYGIKQYQLDSTRMETRSAPLSESLIINQEWTAVSTRTHGSEISQVPSAEIVKSMAVEDCDGCISDGHMFS